MPVQPQSQVLTQVPPMQQAPMPVYYGGPSPRSLRILIGVVRGAGYILIALGIFMFSSIFTVSVGDIYNYNPMGTIQGGILVIGIGILLLAFGEFIRPFSTKR